MLDYGSLWYKMGLITCRLGSVDIRANVKEIRDEINIQADREKTGEFFLGKTGSHAVHRARLALS